MKTLRAVLQSKWLVVLLIAVVGGFLLTVVIREWGVLVAFPWHINPIYLVLALVSHSIALGATFVAWHLMTVTLADFRDVRLNFRFYYLSTLAKRIPSAIWYVGSRIGMYQQVGVPVAPVANAIVLESAILGLSGVLTLLSFTPFYSVLPTERLRPVAGLGVVGIVFIVARPQFLGGATNWVLRRFGAGELARVPSRHDLVVWMAIYVVPWLFAGTSLYCAIHAVTVGIDIQLVDAIGISTVAMLVSLLSMILPGGLGLKELTAGALLVPYMPFSSALVIVVAYRLMQTVNEVIWALLTTCVAVPET